MPPSVGTSSFFDAVPFPVRCPSGGGWRGRPIIDRCKVVCKATTGARTPPLDPQFGWASNSDVFHTRLCAAVKRAATGFYWSTSGIQPEDKRLCYLNASDNFGKVVRRSADKAYFLSPGLKLAIALLIGGHSRFVNLFISNMELPTGIPHSFRRLSRISSSRTTATHDFDRTQRMTQAFYRASGDTKRESSS